MAIQECIQNIDSTGQELSQHGSSVFPVACYHDDLKQANVAWHWHEELEAVVVSEGKVISAAGSRKIQVKGSCGIFQLIQVYCMVPGMLKRETAGSIPLCFIQG